MKKCQECNCSTSNNLSEQADCENPEYFIIDEDGSKSAAYTLLELEKMRDNQTIMKGTLILKEGN